MAIIHLLSVIVALVAIIFSFLNSRLGLGSHSQTRNYDLFEPLLPPSSLEIISKLSLPPGNVAISSSNRIFFNTHPEYKGEKGFATAKIMEQVSDGKGGHINQAFPNVSFQSSIKTCLSMRIDNQNRLWLLDFANMAITDSPRLFSFQLTENVGNEDILLMDYTFPSEVAGFGSMLNDFNVSPDGNYLYIADTSILASSPGIVVFDIRRQVSYRILNRHHSMYGISSFLNISNTHLSLGPFGIKLNVDSLALSRDGKALYYGALTGDKLFCVDTHHIYSYIQAREAGDQRSSFFMNEIESNIHTVLTNKPATDGITMDDLDNIYMTAIEYSSIALAKPVNVYEKGGKQTGSTTFASMNKKSHTGNRDIPSSCRTFTLSNLISDLDLLRWPDGLSFGPDGLYITSSALHLKFGAIGTNSSKVISDDKPFHITRIPSSLLTDIMRKQEEAGSESNNDGIRDGDIGNELDDVEMIEFYRRFKKLSGQ